MQLYRQAFEENLLLECTPPQTGVNIFSTTVNQSMQPRQHKCFWNKSLNIIQCPSQSTELHRISVVRPEEVSSQMLPIKSD